VYFNTDIGGHAISDARDLRALLGDEVHPHVGAHPTA
jgi:hypothetical protein